MYGWLLGRIGGWWKYALILTFVVGAYFALCYIPKHSVEKELSATKNDVAALKAKLVKCSKKCAEYKERIKRLQFELDVDNMAKEAVDANDSNCCNADINHLVF